MTRRAHPTPARGRAARDLAPSIGRRAACATLAALALAASGCKRGGARCATCGMAIDPKSTWSATLVVGSERRPFDSPRCALVAWRSRGVAATSLIVHEFYGGDERDARELRFVSGSDVDGPMGHDLVPVAPEKAAKFMADHTGERVLTLDEITADVVQHLP